MIIPGGDVVLTPGDVVTLGAEPAGKEIPVHIREIILKKSHPWTGSPIRDIDISRQAFIVMVKRKGKEMPVRGNLVLQEGDRVFLLSKQKKAGMKAGQIEETYFIKNKGPRWSFLIKKLPGGTFFILFQKKNGRQPH